MTKSNECPNPSLFKYSVTFSIVALVTQQQHGGGCVGAGVQTGGGVPSGACVGAGVQTGGGVPSGACVGAGVQTGGGVPSGACVGAGVQTGGGVPSGACVGVGALQLITGSPTLPWPPTLGSDAALSRAGVAVGVGFGMFYEFRRWRLAA